MENNKSERPPENQLKRDGEIKWIYEIGKWWKLIPYNIKEEVTAGPLEEEAVQEEQSNKIMNSLNTVMSTLNLVMERLDTIEAKVNRLEEKVDRLEEKVNRLEAKVNRLEEKVDRLEEKVDRLEEKVDRLEEKVDRNTRILMKHFPEDFI